MPGIAGRGGHTIVVESNELEVGGGKGEGRPQGTANPREVKKQWCETKNESETSNPSPGGETGR